MRMNFAVALIASFVVMVVASSCKTVLSKGSNGDSSVKGLSASANAENVALLMTAYGHTPGYGSYFETDMEQFRALVTDPTGNYRFKTMIGQRVGHNQMLANIRSAASQVSADGTLLLFITAHGSTGGQIQPDDQRYTTLGYADILQAIRDGRNGQPFRRFVFFVSACYSGTWFNSLQSSDGLFKERLVISSVGPNQLSWIAQASRGMLQAFHQLKDSPNATLLNLIGQARANVGDILYSAVPESMMSEPLVNPPSDSTAQPSTEKPSSDKQDGDKSNDRPSEDANNLGRVFAITQNDRRGGVQFFVYSEKKVSKIEMKTGNGWWELTDHYDPQPNINSISATWANASWARESTVEVRLTLPDGTMNEVQANIEHR